MEIMVSIISFMQPKSTKHTILKTSAHIYIYKTESGGKKQQKQRQIHRACGQKLPCQHWYLF